MFLHCKIFGNSFQLLQPSIFLIMKLILPAIFVCSLGAVLGVVGVCISSLHVKTKTIVVAENWHNCCIAMACVSGSRAVYAY